MDGSKAPLAKRNAEMAGYKRIEIDLRKQVEGGRWVVGAMLPSRRDLARQYAVSLVTLDRAIGPLLADGTLRADDRRGTFVLKLPAAPLRQDLREKPGVGYSGLGLKTPGSYAGGEGPLRVGPVGIITSIAPDAAGQEFFILPELEHALSQSGLSTTVLNRVSDPASPVSLTAAVLSMLQEDLSALLIVCLDIDSRQISEEMSRISLDGLPTVLILAGELSLPLPHVFYDNRSGGQQAALHLISHGWPEITIVAPFQASWVSERIEGVRAAAANQADGVRVLEGDGRDWQVSEDPGPLGYEALRAALAAGWRPTGGLVCVNDGVAVGALAALAEWGLEAGRDFGILGFDDEARARIAGLTSLRPPMQSMAREAVRLLLDHRQGADTSLQVRLRAHVIPRASTRTHKL